jgi:precorrin-6B methylase 2
MSIDEILDAAVERLQGEGLVITTAEIADEGLKLMKAKERLMRRNHLTPYEISKFKLIGEKSILTIKNMVKDGRIMQHEYFIDKGGKMYITREGVKRLMD